MTGAKLLADAADGHAASRRWLRTTVERLLEVRGFPAHAGSILTAILAGWDVDGYPEEIVEKHSGAFGSLGHDRELTRPAVIGSFAEVSTPTKLGALYGEIVCSHRDPPETSFDEDGSLNDPSSTRRCAVMDLEVMPAGLRADPSRQTRLSRLRQTGRWMDQHGHLVYDAPDTPSVDELSRYCHWLADVERDSLRAGVLPADEQLLADTASALLEMLAGYRQTFVRTGDWLWLREPYEARLSAPIGQGRLNRDDCRRLFAQATAHYDQFADGPLERTVANELRFLAKRWSSTDRRILAEGTSWVTSLFVANAYLTEQTFDGPPLVETDDGRVLRIAADASFGLAGHWTLTPVSDEEAAAVRAQYRGEAEQAGKTNHEGELAVTADFPFRVRLSQAEFDAGLLRLPEDAAARLDSREPVSVRLAYTPTGRFRSKPVAIGSSARLDGDRTLPLEWPALLEVGTTLEGRVTRRGRHIELSPT